MREQGVNDLRQASRAASVFLFAPLLSGSALAAENCIFQIHGAEEPYYVLGTRVVPQSNYLIVSGCEKTVEQVLADLVAPAKELAQAVAAEQARAKAARVEGDALVQARDRQRLIDAGKRAGLQDLWAWIGSWFGQSSQP